MRVSRGTHPDSRHSGWRPAGFHTGRSSTPSSLWRRCTYRTSSWRGILRRKHADDTVHEHGIWRPSPPKPPTPEQLTAAPLDLKSMGVFRICDWVTNCGATNAIGSTLSRSEKNVRIIYRGIHLYPTVLPPFSTRLGHHFVAIHLAPGPRGQHP